MKKFLLLIPIGFLLLSCGGTLPQIVKFDTRPQAPFKGDTVLLEWIVRGADKVTLDGEAVPDSGNKWIVMDKSRDFILKATAPRAESTKKLDIVVPIK